MRKVVITTEYGGVFFGELVENNAPESLKLKNARNCIYWNESLEGFMGLAKVGPNEKCKIGPNADIELFNITAIIDCTPEAISNWEKATWGN